MLIHNNWVFYAIEKTWRSSASYAKTRNGGARATAASSRQRSSQRVLNDIVKSNELKSSLKTAHVIVQLGYVHTSGHLIGKLPIGLPAVALKIAVQFPKTGGKILQCQDLPAEFLLNTIAG